MLAFDKEIFKISYGEMERPRVPEYTHTHACKHTYTHGNVKFLAPTGD